MGSIPGYVIPKTFKMVPGQGRIRDFWKGYSTPLKGVCFHFLPDFHKCPTETEIIWPQGVLKLTTRKSSKSATAVATLLGANSLDYLQL